MHPNVDNTEYYNNIFTDGEPIDLGHAATEDDNDTWKRTKDHSKWTISEKNDYVCIGDMNHMDT